MTEEESSKKSQQNPSNDPKSGSNAGPDKDSVGKGSSPSKSSSNDDTEDFLRDQYSGFRIVRDICAGLDVHKRSVVATVVKSDQKLGRMVFYTRSYPTTNASLHKLAKWLESFNCRDVCMESTGRYWVPIYNILELHKMNVILTHPKYVKAIKGKKTDKKDSRWIATLFRHDMVKNSFIPEPKIRAMRELNRYRVKLVHMATQEKQRYQNGMTMSNIRTDCIFSDPFGKSAMRVMKYLMSGEPFDEAKIPELIDRRCKASVEEVLEHIRGFNIYPEQYLKLRECSSHLDEIFHHESVIRQALADLSAEYKHQIDLLCTMPGIKREAAMHIISETGVDMSVFESDRHICSWAGLVPADNESAKKKKSTKCSKGDRYLKPLLVQCALAAVKSNKSDYFRIKYEGIKRRRGHKKAIIAIARMMLKCIFHMLKENTPFNPTDYDKVMASEKKKEPKYTVNGAIEFLKEQGIDGELIEKIQRTIQNSGAKNTCASA